ncbi:MAG: hypothetical protein JNM81_15570 [Rhodospirillaceae bacterium]|nr:hypothetical protein [Rhodospirillaceae bacterium]
MKTLTPVMTAVSVFISLFSISLFPGYALAHSPHGFRADWHRAEVAVNDALLAAREGALDDMRSESESAIAAMLDLADYATELPPDERAVYSKALDDARVAAQRLKAGGITNTKDTAAAAQNALQKFSALRALVPADWFRAGACTGMRKQRRQC